MTAIASVIPRRYRRSAAWSCCAAASTDGVTRTTIDVTFSMGTFAIVHPKE